MHVLCTSWVTGGMVIFLLLEQTQGVFRDDNAGVVPASSSVF